MMRRLELMLAELESNQLQTVLAPSKRHDRRDWDFIRVNVSENPKWYKKFCAMHTSSRGTRRGKHDTIIRRMRTIEALNRLINKAPNGGLNEQRLLDFARGLKP